MWLTRLEWLRVYGSRASTAFESASIVCSNSSLRLDVPRVRQPRREERNDEQGRGPPANAIRKLEDVAISHATGARPARL